MSTRNDEVFVGCAGWQIRGDQRQLFPPEGSHLERYARVFPGVEVNSSFYRAHRLATWQRWAASVPAGFRFSVKLPKEITHERCLVGTHDCLAGFLAQVAGLEGRLGTLLLQLAPSFACARRVAEPFLHALRASFGGGLVLEPRHASWFDARIDALLRELRIARAAVDPAPVPEAALPGGWRGLLYFRLHGSPEIYTSPYGEERLRDYARRLEEAPEDAERWCIFDNTKFGASMVDALRLRELLERCETRGQAPGSTSDARDARRDADIPSARERRLSA